MEGFDSQVPVVIDLDAPRDGVPLVIESQSGLERCAAAIAAGTGPQGLMQNGPQDSGTASARSWCKSGAKAQVPG
ncbi:ribonuclease D [Arthrobacter sp. Hiyo4]|nr:ribonuclease D [Arthrobacter sp. Hiyo4]